MKSFFDFLKDPIDRTDLQKEEQVQVVRRDAHHEEHVDRKHSATAHIDEKPIEQIVSDDLRPLHDGQSFFEIAEIPIQDDIDNQDGIAGLKQTLVEHFLERNIEANRDGYHEHKRDNHKQNYQIPCESKRSRGREHWHPFQF